MQAPPIYKMLYINNIKSTPVKLFFLYENFSNSNFASVKPTKHSYMKKYLLLIGVIISIAIQASAAKEDIYMTIYRKGNESIDKTIHRSPMLLPVDV